MQFVAQQAQQVSSPNPNANNRGRLTDLRGLGGPPTVAGEHDKYRQWMDKFIVTKAQREPSAAGLAWKAYRVHFGFRHRAQFRAGGVCGQTLRHGAPAALVRQHSTTCQGGRPLGNGLETYRALKTQYEPKTPCTKRAVLKHIVSVESAARVDEVEQNPPLRGSCAPLRRI